MKKEISIAFQTDKKLLDYGKIGKKIEDFGFDRISVYNDLLYQPAWYPLYEIAKATSSIILGPAAVNPFTSHPINIAGNIVLLNEISNGRAYLGLARGAWLDFLGINHKQPITALKEAFICINHLMHQNKEPVEAKYFPLKGGDSLRWDINHVDIPFLLGSWGLKTIDWCAEYIQEVKLGGSANPDIVPYYMGKDEKLKSTEIGIVLGAVTVVDEDGEKARNLARKEVALYLPVIAALDKTTDISSDVLDTILIATDKFDYDTASEYITDNMLKKFAFAGTPDDIIKQTLEIYEKGASRVEFGTPHGITMNNGMDLLGNQVLPEIKQYLNEVNI